MAFGQNAPSCDPLKMLHAAPHEKHHKPQPQWTIFPGPPSSDSIPDESPLLIWLCPRQGQKIILESKSPSPKILWKKKKKPVTTSKDIYKWNFTVKTGFDDQGDQEISDDKQNLRNLTYLLNQI